MTSLKCSVLICILLSVFGCRSVELPAVAASNSSPQIRLPELSNSRLGSREFAPCFVGVGSSIQQITFAYKQIYERRSDRWIQLRAYVFKDGSTANRARPAIAMFHGGGWKDGYPMTWFPSALYYASKGFITVAFQYRTFKTHRSIPQDSLEDAKSAIHWMKKNASSLDIDANRILAAGDSAGAHLALGLSLLPNVKEVPNNLNVEPRAILAFYPVIDASLLGYSGIPSLHAVDLSRLPPTFILQGNADTEIGTPPSLTKTFCTMANTGYGALCEGVFFDGPDYFHGFIGARKPYLEALNRMDRFLEGRGFLKPSPRMMTSSIHSEACQASADSALFRQWVIDYGYSTPESSLW